MMKPQNYSAAEGTVMVFFVRDKLKKLIDVLDDIIQVNSDRYTRMLFALNEQLKDFPAFVDLSKADELLDLMIDTTHELTSIIKNANHANYFLDKDELNVYTAFKLIELLEMELTQFERSF